MTIYKDKIYKLKEVASILRVSRSTLRAWDRERYFVAGRTKGRHRIYLGCDILKMQEKMFLK